MNRLVNILMIVIIVSCPIRCMMQAGECCVSTSSCCSASHPDCLCELDPVECESEGESENTPSLPDQCQCSCFCSGVIVADDFVLAENASTPLLIHTIDTATLQSTYRHSLESSKLHPPDNLADRLSTNRGRQIRCQINSLLI